MSLPTRLENSDIKTDVSPFLFGHRSMFRAFLWLLVCNCLPFPARPSLFCFSGEVELYAFSFLCQGISLVNFSTSFAFFRPLVPSLHILRWLLFTSPGSVSVGTVSIPHFSFSARGKESDFTLFIKYYWTFPPLAPPRKA